MNAAGPDVGHLASTAATPTVDGARPAARVLPASFASRISDARLTLVIVGAVLLGLALTMLLTPVVGRGDFGQWLMTSRFYLGESVPGYRVIPALPPLVPMALAAMRVVVRDPAAALQLLNAVLLVSLGVSFYLLGSRLFASRLAGALAVVGGLLVTDRYLELFAFGGLLQAAAVIAMCLGVVGLFESGRRERLALVPWIAGSICFALAVLAHLGTSLIAVPVGLVVGSVVLWSHRHDGPRLWPAVIASGVVVVALGAYFLAVVLPNSRDYLANPASLAYRGPDRLFVALFSYPPTLAIVALGAAVIAWGTFSAARRRRLTGSVVLAIWVVIAWGALAYSTVSGAATDYPRFATVLLAPFVVAAAGGLRRGVEAIALTLERSTPAVPQLRWASILLGLVVVVSAPIIVQRYAHQAATYQPLDAAALDEAAAWIDAHLSDPNAAILTNVREGKWIEGTTGRATLFSQPVRYAFRPIEWQRSVDADALLRSTLAMTNGFWLATYGEARATSAGTVPTGLALSVNHGGELVRILESRPSLTSVSVAGTSTTLDRLAPENAATSSDAESVSHTSRFIGALGTASVEVAQTVRVWADSTTLELTEEASQGTLGVELGAPGGMALTSLDVHGHEGLACFTEIGGREPCVRIWIGQDDGALAWGPNGGIQISTAASSRIDVHLTAVTPGEPSVGLGLLDPPAIVDERDLGAALLYAPDPAYPARAQRLHDLGFEFARVIGPYRVFLNPEHGGSLR
jgi:hypothetical protein